MAKRKGRQTRHRGIKDLGNGMFVVRAYGTDPKTGKPVEKERRVRAKSVAEAQQKKLELELEMQKEEREEPASKQHKRLGDVADEWLAEITARRLEEDPMQMHLLPTTRSRYTGSVCDFIKPFFGERIAGRITQQDVLDWRQNLLEHGYSREYLNGHHRVLKQILKGVGNDAAAKVKELNTKVGARITRKEPNLLTGEELDRFLEEAREHWPQHYALILVLFTTTMRTSTALALRRDDLDLETMEFVVQRRLSDGEEHPGVKRNRFGEDAPPLLPEVLEALKAHWATFNERQKGSGLMFPAADGRHHDRTLLRKPFKDILVRAGITKRFTPHGCRRTGAKLYGRTAGTRMAMEIAGHRTLAMHERYTPHDAVEKQNAARSAFGKLRVFEGGARQGAGKTGDETGDREEARSLPVRKSSESL